jgi:hypothetical protein
LRDDDSAGALEDIERTLEAHESLETSRGSRPGSYPAVFLLAELGRLDEARALVVRQHRFPWLVFPWRRQQIYSTEMGRMTASARVRLSAAEKLIQDARHAEAREQLDKALAFYRSVRATRYIRQAEQLLAAASHEQEQAAQPHA